SSCGNITISGGQIGGYIGNNFYDGIISNQAAAIGCWNGGTCGTITIDTNVPFIMAQNKSAGNHNLIGAYNISSFHSDIFFGTLKVYDKGSRRWYNNSTGDYSDNLPLPVNFGDLSLERSGSFWTLRSAPRIGKFTVNASGGQVYFAKGNLKCNYFWSFHAHQYDRITSGGYPMDLFTWGNISYTPSSDGTDYDHRTAPLSYNGDWGSNIGKGWRTLTQEEWAYVFNTRTTTSGVRYAKAVVNGVNGVILLPDDWSTTYYPLSNTDKPKDAFTNVITADVWTSSLEAHGAVFLPAAGNRIEANIDTSGEQGNYWSSSPVGASTTNAYYLNFSAYNMTLADDGVRSIGRSVRLVYDVE
ncbi:MAG: hypothetical protein J6X99_08025, partial [Bacteroidales bacterium]|nr:hypothetical protein [Bacteroidales bacterium]